MIDFLATEDAAGVFYHRINTFLSIWKRFESLTRDFSKIFYAFFQKLIHFERIVI